LSVYLDYGAKVGDTRERVRQITGRATVMIELCERRSSGYKGVEGKRYEDGYLKDKEKVRKKEGTRR
jgi:hypothetical protein